MRNPLLDRLRYHVTGAIERGEGAPIVGRPAPRIVRAWRTPAPAPRLDAQGYTRREGSPTDIMLQLDGEARPRRLYARAFSNAASLFFRFKRGDVYVSECDLPTVEPTPPAR